MKKIGVLGAGTFGMALARMLSNSGNEVTVWSAIESEIDLLSKERKHPNLKGMVIPLEVQFTKDMEDVISDKDLILFAVPSVFVRSTAEKAAKYLTGKEIVVDVAKGLESDTLFTMSEVIKDAFIKVNPDLSEIHVVALSGPTHAEEVALDLPTTIVSSCDDLNAAEYVQDTFMNTCMRVYTNTDMKGVELCGAMKNIIALACGASEGLKYGDNTKAAIITRGMAEITRLGLKMGCKEQTFSGLSGIGDLIVTATSVHSRNNKCGKLLGEGYSLEEAKEKVGMVVEGINAVPAAIALSKKYQVELPITEAVFLVLNGKKTPKDAVAELMMREKKSEHSIL